MRIKIITLAVAWSVASIGFAQAQKPSAVQSSKAPQRAPSPQRSPQQSPNGYYASPPRSGTFAGASNSVGVEGLALHFPAMSLKLPTLQLPSLFSLRSPPKVMMDPAMAPFVEQQQPIGVGAPVAVQALQAPVDPSRSPEPNRSPAQRTMQKGAYLQDSHDEVAALRAQVVELMNRLERQKLAESHPVRNLAPPAAPSLQIQRVENDPSKLERLEHQVQQLQQVILQLAQSREGNIARAAHLTPVPERVVAARLMQPQAAKLSAPQPVATSSRRLPRLDPERTVRRY